MPEYSTCVLPGVSGGAFEQLPAGAEWICGNTAQIIPQNQLQYPDEKGKHKYGW
jgi:hypothetical protein